MKGLHFIKSALLIAGCVTCLATTAKNITIINATSKNQLTVYMGFVGNNFACYTKQSFSSVCKFNTSNPYVCQFTVNQGTPVSLKFKKSCQVSVAFTADNLPWGACPTSLAEFTLNATSGGDTIDVSLVNGRNYNIDINTSSNISVINMSKAKGALNTLFGVYPPGCDGCAVSINPPTWPNCPGSQPKANCQKGTQYNPKPGCQITRPTNSDSYNVTFTKIK